MKPLASVAVLTYNSESTIRQCLDSIIKQKVDFDYEIVVGDDGSTDNTLDILKSYENTYSGDFVLIKSPRNEGISRNYQKVLMHCKGKYVALCEGDDFWTVEDKLQKQVDFLEHHEKYGFVGGYSRLLFSNGVIKEDPYDYLPKSEVVDGWELYGNVFEYAKYGPVTRTVSLCFRRSIIEPYLQYEGLGCDLVLQTVLAKHSFFAKYSQVTTIYRQGGVSTDRYDFDKQQYYNNWYVKNRLLQKALFPQECNWNEDELSDSGCYIQLRQAVAELDWRKALELKKRLKTENYKNKKYSKVLFGPLTCCMLSYIHKRETS